MLTAGKLGRAVRPMSKQLLKQAVPVAAVGIRNITSASAAAEKVSFVKGLFFGEVNKRAFPYPDTLDDESRETLKMLVEPVQKFFESGVDSKKIDETKEIPEAVLNELRSLGLFGLQIPQDNGGLGLSNTGYARVCEEFTDASLAVTLMAHQSIGLKGILLSGNDEQGTPTAAHEKKLAEAFAELAENRIKINVREILTFSKSDEKISSIADEIFKENKYLPPHPTNV
eukprot:Colp12_sorted_trinity150504_noHs@12768